MILRHEQVVHAKIVAARTAQANGVPGVEDLGLVIEEHAPMRATPC